MLALRPRRGRTRSGSRSLCRTAGSTVTDQQGRGDEPLDAEGGPGPDTVRELQEKPAIRSDLGPPDQRWAQAEGVKGCIGDLDCSSKGAHESSGAPL